MTNLQHIYFKNVCVFFWNDEHSFIVFDKVCPLNKDRYGKELAHFSKL